METTSNCGMGRALNGFASSSGLNDTCRSAESAFSIEAGLLNVDTWIVFGMNFGIGLALNCLTSGGGGDLCLASKAAVVPLSRELVVQTGVFL